MAENATPEVAKPAWPALRRLLDWDFPDMFSRFDTLLPGGPQIRVEEELADNELVIRAEAPGIDPEKDAQVTIERGRLQIRVERRQEQKEEAEGRYRSEFRYGSFFRSVPLPEGCQEADVKAAYHDGILEVHVPLAEQPPPARVEITKA